MTSDRTPTRMKIDIREILLEELDLVADALTRPDDHEHWVERLQRVKRALCALERL